MLCNDVAIVTVLYHWCHITKWLVQVHEVPNVVENVSYDMYFF